MAQRKLRPFAEILNLVDALNDEQHADLLDYLRGKQPKKERKARQPKPLKETTKAEGKCATCGKPESDAGHNEASDDYHIFRTSLKSK